MAGKERVAIRGKNWKKKSTIDAEKFDTISKAILTSLTSDPITYTELANRVISRVNNFDGSVRWYTLTCAREMEVRGQIIRQEKPVRYLKAPRGTKNAKAGR